MWIRGSEAPQVSSKYITFVLTNVLTPTALSNRQSWNLNCNFADFDNCGWVDISTDDFRWFIIFSQITESGILLHVYIYMALQWLCVQHSSFKLAEYVNCFNPTN